MRKDFITIKVAEQQVMRIEAYVSDDVEGLAFHRQVVWDSYQEKHKFVSKWAITHIPSGRMILYPSQCPDTLGKAILIATELIGVDWTEEEPSVSSSIIGRAVNEASKYEPPEVAATGRRYVVSPADGGYAVIDTETDTQIGMFRHRGMARWKADELNEGQSL